MRRRYVDAIFNMHRIKRRLTSAELNDDTNAMVHYMTLLRDAKQLVETLKVQKDRFKHSHIGEKNYRDAVNTFGMRQLRLVPRSNYITRLDWELAQTMDYRDQQRKKWDQPTNKQLDPAFQVRGFWEVDRLASDYGGWDNAEKALTKTAERSSELAAEIIKQYHNQL